MLDAVQDSVRVGKRGGVIRIRTQFIHNFGVFFERVRCMILARVGREQIKDCCVVSAPKVC